MKKVAEFILFMTRYPSLIFKTVVFFFSSIHIATFGQSDSLKQNDKTKIETEYERQNNKIDSLQNQIGAFVNPDLNKIGKQILSGNRAFKRDSIKFIRSIEKKKRSIQLKIIRGSNDSITNKGYIRQIDSLNQLKFDRGHSARKGDFKATPFQLGKSKINEVKRGGDSLLTNAKRFHLSDTLNQANVNNLFSRVNKVTNSIDAKDGVLISGLNKNEKLNIPNDYNFNLESESIQKTVDDVKVSLPEGNENQKEQMKRLKDKLAEVTSADEVKRITEKVNGVNVITDKLQHYGDDVNSAVKGNLNEVKEIPATLEQQAMKIDEISTLEKETGGFDKYKELLNQGKDSSAVSQLALKQTKSLAQPTINHFAGKEQVLQQAIDELASLKKKFGHLQQIKDGMPRKLRNAMYGKPFIEHIVLGLTYQIQKNVGVLVDYNPHLGYKFTGRLSAGLGWNERFTVPRFLRFSLMDRIYGVRSYVDFKFWKGFSFRSEVEKMNTFIPAIAAGRDNGRRSWVWSCFVGLKKEYRFLGPITGNVQVLYNLYDDHYNSPYNERLVVRMGFNYSLRNKKKTSLKNI